MLVQVAHLYRPSVVIAAMSLDPLRLFFSANNFAVVGASTDPAKYGNKITNWYVRHKLPVTPINPKSPVIYNIQAAESVTSAINDHPGSFSFSVVTPPAISQETVKSLAVFKDRVKGVWFQPGSYDTATLDLIAKLGIDYIAGGRCVLVEGEKGLNLVGKL
ncbi:CoA binding domain-containing protein [Lipomyces japonicus]|uniref:CoA binding domain-containing protein n=1 Tax=Lipomyces japonicus TaxID=56871 RepID=UPI0034CDECCF